MYALIPAAGYGTRLYPLTKNRPKALIDIDKKPMLEYIVNKILELPKIKKIVVISNALFYKQFNEWNSGYGQKHKIEILNDGTKSDEEKLGTVGDINFAINKLNIDDDILIVNSDNLFNFSLKDVYSFFRQKNAPVLALFDVKSREKARLYGVISVDSGNKIVDFVEKPPKPKSTLVSTGIYLFPRDTISYFGEYLSVHSSADKSGYFMEWLFKKETVYGYPYEGTWFDIGSFNSLEEARDFFRNHKK